jgi:putative MATE family efflux protein
MRSPPGAAPDVKRLLDAPILPTLLTLAAPSVLAMLMQVLVGIAETLYVGLLGTTPLAAMALVFPFLMLSQQLSAGAMGGGVSSAIARALGAGNNDRANALALHAITIGALLGVVFTVVMLGFGPGFYRLLGGRDAVLAEAIGYSQVLFLAAIFIWLSNTLASVLRGTGNMRIPSLVILGASVLQIALGGVLALGAGPVPSLGMPGVAIACIMANVASVGFFAWYLIAGRSRLRLRLRGARLQREMFVDILKVGALSMLSPLQSVLTVLIFTGFVAHLGVAPLAGYSIGQRLEFLLIPISFGIGVASVPMVGMAMGAGQVARARKVAWTAGLVSAFNVGVIGLTVAIFPDLWAAIFTSDPAVLGHAREFLQIAGPAFAFFGLGITLYFASQGSGRMLGPVLAGTVRLVMVFAVGTWLVGIPATAAQLFGLVAGSMVVYGLAVVVSVRITRWGR